MAWLDVAGNVWEWVADWHGEYPSGRHSNPTGPASGDKHVLRGGCWGDVSRLVRVAERGTGELVGAYGDVGFRCAVPAR